MDENGNTNSPQCAHQSKGKLAHNWTKLIKKHRIIFGFFFSHPSCFLFEKEEDLDTFYFPPLQMHLSPTWSKWVWKY